MGMLGRSLEGVDLGWGRRHNHYRVKRATDTGTHHCGPATVTITTHAKIKLS